MGISRGGRGADIRVGPARLQFRHCRQKAVEFALQFPLSRLLYTLSVRVLTPPVNILPDCGLGCFQQKELKMVYSSRFVLSVLLNGNIAPERTDGVVAIPFGSEYGIRCRNRNKGRRALVKLFVDNENISGGGFIIGQD